MNNAFTRKRPLILIISMLVLLISCSPIQATTNPPTTPKPFIFKITKVVDKFTGEPVGTNYLKVFVETGEKDQIIHEAINIGEDRIEIPVGTEVHLRIEAPGYHKWELVILPNASKYMEGPVELVPVVSPEEINGF